MSIDALLAKRDDLLQQLRQINSELLSHLNLWESKALHGYRIQAISQLREERNLGLREAIDAVDAFIESQNCKSVL